MGGDSEGSVHAFYYNWRASENPSCCSYCLCNVSSQFARKPDSKDGWRDKVYLEDPLMFTGTLVLLFPAVLFDLL